MGKVVNGYVLNQSTINIFVGKVGVVSLLYLDVIMGGKGNFITKKFHMRCYHEMSQACLVNMQPAPTAEWKDFAFVREEKFKNGCNNHTRIASSSVT